MCKNLSLEAFGLPSRTLPSESITLKSFSSKKPLDDPEAVIRIFSPARAEKLPEIPGVKPFCPEIRPYFISSCFKSFNILVNCFLIRIFDFYNLSILKHRRFYFFIRFFRRFIRNFNFIFLLRRCKSKFAFIFLLTFS